MESRVNYINGDGFLCTLRSLRCGICWDFMKKPHTLKCGHSFCLKCITKLAKLTREQRRKISFYIPKIKFPCPSCREQHSVNTFLKKRAAVNYALQDLSNFWRHQQGRMAKNMKVEIRSTATQHEHESDNEDISYARQENDPREPVSSTEFHYVLPRLDSGFLSHLDNGEFHEHENEINSEESGSLSSDSSSEDSDGFNYHIGQIVRRNARRPDRRVRTGFAGLYYEIYHAMSEIFRSPNRAIMSLIWCGYTFSIMLIANSFFPYMMLYSLLFMLILYAETFQERIRQPIEL